MSGRIDVVIGILIHQQRVLISQRLSHSDLGGFWEFPGGKVELGETYERCLIRELHEELQITVRPIESFDPIDFDYAAASVRLHPFLCELLGGDPHPLAAQQIRWIAPQDLVHYSFPPANDGLIALLIDRFGDPPPADESQAI